MKGLSTEAWQATGKVQVGDSGGTTEVDLSPRKKKETLEANLGNGVKFTVFVTLFLHLPGMEPDAMPESFNFRFTQITHERAPGTCSPKANAPNMRC